MSNMPFTFPPPPPPPPRRDTHTAPTFPQSNYPYAQPGRGRGRGSGFGVRGDSAGQYGRGRADYRGHNSRGAYGRGGNGNAGAYAGYQQHNSYAAPYGKTNNYASSRDQNYTSDQNQATRGGATQSHGFHHNGPNGPYLPSLYRPSSRDRPPQNSHPPLPSSGGPQPPRKRPYSTAFTKPTTTGPRPQAAPAVPSFNAGILLSVPAKPVEPSPAKTKKPRKHNQLGLTPASQDHESSSDDENEEAKLASNTLDNANVVQFEYNGRTATLRTAADIAAWIAERKKRFPTQAKAEAAKKEAAEKKRNWEEAKKQREETAQAKRLERNRGQQEELRLKALESKKHKAEHKELKMASKVARDETGDDDEHEIRAKKARIKAEKLRLKANKAELKVLEAEAAARKARNRRASLPSGASAQDEASAKEGLAQDADSAIALEDANDEAVAGVMSKALDLSKVTRPPIQDEDNDKDKTQISDLSSEFSSSSPLISEMSDAESTSSSGSSSSDSSSDSDSDAAPEQTTSKRLHPTRVLPPPRHPPGYTNNLCRRLLATGHCHFGAGCHYSHDLPDTLPSLDVRKGKLKQKRKVRLGKSKATDNAAAPAKERRKGLWQVMVEKEEAEERKQVLRAIVFMGENGMLGEDGVNDKADAAKRDM